MTPGAARFNSYCAMLATRSDGYYEDAAATHGMGNTGAFTAAKEIIKKRFDLLRILLQTFLRAQHPPEIASRQLSGPVPRWRATA